MLVNSPPPSVEIISDGYALCDDKTLQLVYCNDTFKKWFDIKSNNVPLGDVIEGAEASKVLGRIRRRGYFTLNIDNDISPDMPILINLVFNEAEFADKSYIAVHARDYSILKEKDVIIKSHAIILEKRNEDLVKRTEQLKQKDEQLQALSSKLDKYLGDDQIVCDCLQITRGRLNKAIFDGGCFKVADLVETTGASSVCGHCRKDLVDMVGREDWIPVRVTQTHVETEDIRSFQFAPYKEGLVDYSFKLAQPGQHILVQSYINGAWVQRPYTISSAGTENSFREITVKKEPLGYFSEWLFDKSDENTFFRISDPRGNYYAELGTQPIICFAAGIGVTPSLAIVRSALREKLKTPIHIDYSASQIDRMSNLEELRKAAAEHEHISLHTRATEKAGRISQVDVQKLHLEYPNAAYFICGPTGYQLAVAEHLRLAGVADANIHVETFTSGESGIVDDLEKNGRFSLTNLIGRSTYAYLGFLLLLGFFAQDVYQWEWGWLQSLQAGESYKRWSGVFLTAFMVSQWILPAFRLRGNFKAAARYYTLHKYAGAFSPLFYYVHSTEFGYAYLFVLSTVFFANTLLGVLNKEIVIFKEQIRQQTYNFYWLIGHVSLSVLTVVLILYHIFIVFYY